MILNRQWHNNKQACEHLKAATCHNWHLSFWSLDANQHRFLVLLLYGKEQFGHCIILCPVEEKQSNRFGKSGGWVNDDKFLKSGWTLAKGDKYTSLVYPPLKCWSIIYSMGPLTCHSYRFPILLPFSEAYNTESIGSLWPLDWTVCLSQ